MFFTYFNINARPLEIPNIGQINTLNVKKYIIFNCFQEIFLNFTLSHYITQDHIWLSGGTILEIIIKPNLSHKSISQMWNCLCVSCQRRLSHPQIFKICVECQFCANVWLMFYIKYIKIKEKSFDIGALMV